LRFDINLKRESWKLPENYVALGPQTQKDIIRSCVMSYMDNFGKARIKEISSAIEMPDNSQTLLKSLNYLVTTQQLYSDGRWRDPTYYKNGRLSHPILQSNVSAGRKEYAIRTYSGETGKWITITEYESTPTHEVIPRSGIRIDLGYVEVLTNELSRIKRESDNDPNLVEAPNLRRKRKDEI
jgi:hypothetical protein